MVTERRYYLHEFVMVKESEGERTRRAFDDPTSYLRNNPYVALRAQAIRRMVPATSPKSIVDLGCGDGRISIPLVADKDELFLVDISKRMLEIAIQNVPAEIADRVQFECTDLATFEPTRQFDVVLCIGVLAHVPNRRSLIELVSRCVAPGGCALLQFTDNSYLLGRVTNRLYVLLRRLFHPAAHRLNQMTIDDVLSDMAEQGFRLTASHRYVYLPGLQRLPSLFSRAMAQLGGSKPVANCGGEVIAAFSRYPRDPAR